MIYEVCVALAVFPVLECLVDAGGKSGGRWISHVT